MFYGDIVNFMNATDLERNKTALLEAVPPDGTSAGNNFLREKLGLTIADYQATVDVLVDDGVLERWRGRGGTLRRTSSSIELKARTKASAEEERVDRDTSSKSRVLEAKLYPPFLASLRLWANDQGWTQHVVNQLAFQGRRSTGGVWTRPDFVVSRPCKSPPARTNACSAG